MAKPSLIFHEIRLGGMPGFELDDRFTVRGLGGGLTVVHGPNGIGKTTLARAMQLLMWSDLPAGRTVHLEARASLAGAEQRRLRSGDSLSVRGADGAELDDPVPWLGQEVQNRYFIGIQDLLQREQPGRDPNEAFARAVRTQTQGVDLDEVGRRVEALESLSGRPNNDYRAVLEARQQVVRLRDLQWRNRDLEQEIGGLAAQLEDRPGRIRTREALAERVQALRLAAELLALEAPLEPFRAVEAALEPLQAHFGDAFEQRLADRAEQEAQAGRIEADLAATRADLAYLDLQAEARAADLEEARRLRRALEAAELQVAAVRARGRQAVAAREAWLASSAWLDGCDGTLPPITARMLEDAGRIAGQLEDAWATQAAWEAVAAALEPQGGAAPAGSGRLALGLLQGWLAADAQVRARVQRLDREQAGRGQRGLAWGLLAGALVLAVLAAAVPLAQGNRAPGPWLAGLAGICLAVAMALLRRTGGPEPAGEAPEAVRRYLEDRLAALGFQGPWDESRVKALTEALLDREVACADAAARQQLLATARDGADRELQRRRELLADQARGLAGLGEGPALLERKGFLGLVVHHVKELQEHREAVAQAEGDLAGATEALEACRMEADLLLERYGRREEGRHPQALDSLHGLLARALDLQGTCADLARRLPAEREKAAEARRRLEAFLAGAGGLDEAAFAALWRRWLAWTGPHGAWADKLRAVRATSFRFPETAAHLAPFLDHRETPLQVRREALAEAQALAAGELEAAGAALAALEEVQRRHTTQELLLAGFLREGALAAAIQEAEARCRGLEEARLGALAGRALDLVLARQKQLVEEQDRPEVVRLASEHFLRFTNRYELTYADGRFLARDGQLRLDPGALSDGTRVQLLLAVRLAFVEQNERVQLPIFLDEVLANADDQRADAIVRTVLQIAATGRQVFYFTAQRDELERWRQLEGAGGNPPVDLAAVRNQAVAELLPLPGRDWEPPAVPDPGGRPLLDYVRGLEGAAGPALWTPLERQHPYLALVAGDEELLAGLLRRRVLTLGNLKRVAALDPREPYPEIAATLQVLEQAQELLRRYRGRPLTAEAIQEIDLRGFGPALKTRLAGLLDEAGGDLEALFRAGLPGAFSAREEALRAWLEDHGHLVTGGLGADEIMIELRAGFRAGLAEDSPRWRAVERYVREAR